MKVLLDGRLDPSNEEVEFLLELLSMQRFEVLRPSDSVGLGVGWGVHLEEANGVQGWRSVRVDQGSQHHSSHALRANGWNEDPALVERGDAIPVAPAHLPAALTDIARTLRADVLVSPDAAAWQVPGAIRPVDPPRGLALLGLHTRASGSHVLWAAGASTASTGLRWASWMEAARQLRPIWSTKLALDPQDSAAAYLQACLERMRQLLRIRDEAMLSGLVTADSSRYDGVEALESGALASMAVLDALARAVNCALRLEINPIALNWWKTKPLVKSLRRTEQAAYDLLTQEQTEMYLQVIAGLRNTIHAEPLTEALLERRPGRTESVAMVPADVSGDLQKRIRLLGLEHSWKAADAPNLLLDPAQVLQDLTRWTAALANTICNAITWPVVGVAPPLELADPESPRSERNFKRNGWLYGIDVWSSTPPDVWMRQAI